MESKIINYKLVKMLRVIAESGSRRVNKSVVRKEMDYCSLLTHRNLGRCRQEGLFTELKEGREMLLKLTPKGIAVLSLVNKMEELK